MIVDINAFHLELEQRWYNETRLMDEAEALTDVPSASAAVVSLSSALSPKRKRNRGETDQQPTANDAFEYNSAGVPEEYMDTDRQLYDSDVELNDYDDSVDTYATATQPKRRKHNDDDDVMQIDDDDVAR
jgi:hypothetical protein